MKFRLGGFVANSSSTSFVVAFPRKPETVDDIKHMLFPESQKIYPEYSVWSDNYFSIDKIARRVFREIKDQKPNDMNRVAEEFEDSGYMDTLYTEIYFDLIRKYKRGEITIEEFDKLREENDENERKANYKRYSDFVSENEGKYIYIFSYSDNDGELESALEHGGLFNNLNHVGISHH